MREVILTTAFRRDYKRLSKGGHDLSILKEVTALLACDLPLEGKYRDHALSGNWGGFRECHLKPDWLLIYKLEPGFLFLTRSGSHSLLFE